jgi:hypothetical protein
MPTNNHAPTQFARLMGRLSYAKDAAGHEHKGTGEGGGQFTGTPGGDSASEGGTPKSPAKESGASDAAPSGELPQGLLAKAKSKIGGWFNKLAGFIQGKGADRKEVAEGLRKLTQYGQDKAKAFYGRMEKTYGPTWAKAIVATAIVMMPTPVTGGAVAAMCGLATVSNYATSPEVKARVGTAFSEMMARLKGGKS